MQSRVRRSVVRLGSLCLIALWQLAAFAADNRGVVGEVVSRRGDEVLVRADGSSTALSIGMPLYAGDEIRTGPYGAAALLFRDDTQVRLHRNTRFAVDEVRGESGVDESRFALLSGSAWSRAKALFRSVTAQVERGRAIARVRTPAATLGIRGTDWHLAVDGAGNTTATVLSGEVELANEVGAVALARGEVGEAVRGRAPTKRVIVDLRDRPLIVLPTGPEWLEILLPPSDDYDGALGAGFAALLAREPERAAAAFADAEKDADPRRAAFARLGALTTLVEQQRYAEADARMADFARAHADLPETALAQAWLASFAGDHPGALEILRVGEARFPSDPRLPTLAAHVHFLRDDRAAMQAALARAMALAPDYHLAWYEQGLFHQFSEPDGAAAIAAFDRALDARAGFAPARMQRAQVYYDLGDYRAAVRDFEAALAADPGSALIHAAYGIVCAYLGRLPDAQHLLERAQALDADEPYAALGLAFLDLLRGAPQAGVERTLKAAVANPELPGVDWFLAAGTYQAGDYARTRQALATARKRDPDDPIPDLIGSVSAVDNFEAGEAIRLARDGFDKTLRAKSFAVDTLANARGGSATLGQAYSNLGLDAWGGYYSLLAFDPYTAGDYFYLSQANQFASERARLGANLQGLLLDPTAVSFPTRYYEPFRQERHDLILGGAVGVRDGGFNYTAGGSLQGLWRRPDPIAYFVSGAREYDGGYRADNATSHENVQFQVGTSFGEQAHNLLFQVTAQSFHQQIPGSASDGDPDDRQTNQFVFADLGYQYRFDYHNRVMARVAGGYEQVRFANGSPFGRGLSSRDYSLIGTFGLPATRALYAQGLYDVTALAVARAGQSPRLPLVFTGPLSPLLCVAAFGETCPPSDDSLAAAVDDDPTLNETVSNAKRLVQVRHLFDVGPVELTYGAEYGWFDSDVVLNAVGARLFGIGTLAGAGVALPACVDIGVVNGPGQCAFPWADPVMQRGTESRDAHALEAYAQARWKVTADLWLEGAAFYRDVDLDTLAKQQVDPRLGVAWRITPRHWLRATSQSSLIDPLRTQDTLAPVALLGVVVPDAYFTASDTLPASWYHQLRWDAEWSRRVYTFVQVDRQDVEDFSLGFVPDSRLTLFGFLKDGRLDTVSFGTNVWLLENVGLAASYKHLWSENRSPDANRGRALPLISREEFESSLVWVDRRQFTVALTGEYSGARAANLAARRDLDGYWTANLVANWQPLARHLSLTLSIENLLNENYVLAEGFPAAGTSVLLGAEWRF